MIEDELKYYNCLCYRIRILTDKIDALEYDLTGVKGINYDKPIATGSQDPLLKRIRFIEKSDNIERLKIALKVEVAHKDIIDDMLKKLSPEDYELIKLKYIEDLTYEAVADLKHYDKGTMFRKIKSIIESMEKM